MEEQNPIQMPDMSQTVVSSSPHLHDNNSVTKIMTLVIIALLPATGFAVYNFGLNALFVVLNCILSCLLVEAIWCKIAKKANPWKDMSSVLTGLLLGLNMPPTSEWWICLIGGALAITLGKEIFGGIGYNPFNPALVARVGLLIGFTTPMTSWVSPSSMDGMTSATPLGMSPAVLSEKVGMLWQMSVGNISGSVGETSALALLAGGIFLIATKVIKWHIPVSFIGSVALFASACHLVDPSTYIPPMYHVLSGGLFLGAFFMATDMVTSPMTKKGMLIFGFGCGLLTAIIRIWGSYPEGVSFAILFMNALVPLIDRYAAKQPFGAKEAQVLQGGAA